MSECDFTKDCHVFTASPQGACRFRSPFNSSKALRAPLPITTTDNTWTITNVTSSECAKAFVYFNGEISCFSLVDGECITNTPPVSSSITQFISLPKAGAIVSKSISGSEYFSLSGTYASPKLVSFQASKADDCFVFPSTMIADNGTVFTQSELSVGKFYVDGDFMGNSTWYNLACHGNGWSGEICVNSLTAIMPVGIPSAAVTTVPTTIAAIVLGTVLWMVLVVPR